MGVKEVLQKKIGVITGEDVFSLYNYARQHKFAIPSISVSSSSTTVAALEAARDNNSPLIVSISQKSSEFYAGRSLSNSDQSASIAGAISFAHHVRSIAHLYDVPIVLHTDHCKKKHLKWMDGVLEEDQRYFEAFNEPLFSSHMIDLSEEPVDVNIGICADYFGRMSAMNQWLEIEIGVTGSESDGMNHEGNNNPALFTSSETILRAYDTLSKIDRSFQVAASFGNVHGVYQAGNVKLRPEILGQHQDYVRSEMRLKMDKPLFFVFHGGSGSTAEEYTDSIHNGIVKINIDTDTQFSYMQGVRAYVQDNTQRLGSAFGTVDGEGKPNKAFFDPRNWLRKGEQTMSAQIATKMTLFNSAGQL